jgi:hypothetical protein
MQRIYIYIYIYIYIEVPFNIFVAFIQTQWQTAYIFISSRSSGSVKTSVCQTFFLGGTPTIIVHISRNPCLRKWKKKR